MSTMQEVAKKAGVSKATVSRVLSGKGYVSDATKESVFKAIEETGYRPNLLARNLATNKSECIGLVVTNTLYNGSYFNEILSQAAQKLEKNGRQLVLVDGKHSAGEEQEAIQFLLDLRCDAIIIYPRFLTVDAMDLIIDQYKQPIMVVNRKLRKNHSHCIFCDHKGSSYNATKYLIDQGHRDIAFITGSLDSPTAIERLSGYKTALAAFSLPIPDKLIAQGKWTPVSGATAVESLLASQLPFSAIIASNDDMAIGAMKKLNEAGLKVPEDVSIIGFDNIPIAPFLLPPLSSIKDPVSGMINEVINRLISMLDGGYLSNENIFQSELFIRDSVGKGPFFTENKVK
ncbi:TPA: LacI family DNA-binding transcriptional regulator [Yersinia enterocolitica]|uniref:LacI family DNA-binding transcriptional regulator n=1 Tax=Yersinia enterocolitica TaxID=630 RepID=UPI00065A82CE|nr:LacI family DNA-binding transcriptional regulator [Yersinia enterocolitica]CRY12239.1 putative regulatory protein [Yersinia enterocolitica]HDM8290446.1 LacI family DNA-binding transcriptional regulator [Yersinia enterocolitica]HDM8294782.1 LacI family DNA-binding transcriptional regulator [Yersinia enterocolitica]HDM8320435.1 LacI family DNA-binding transcriptional regulator [Yersinia enterocolitica]HDM8332664.1 LacI family DNA-binding transcriptional regulator [Yersinia enterocolitica]